MQDSTDRTNDKNPSPCVKIHFAEYLNSKEVALKIHQNTSLISY